ncbi:MAG: hypothetical protein WC209_00200 [Ignavibacteriaceae bacterium]|jgi:hypothetical protein
MKKALYIQFIFQLILASSIYSQVNFDEANSTRIFIKPSNREINGRVVAVASYGLILEKDETINYKVISRIVTDNEKLLDAVLTFVSNSAKSIDGNEYILEMKEAVSPKPVATDGKILQDQVCMFNVLVSKTEKVGMTFNFSPRMFNNIYFQIGFSTGSYSGGNAYSVSNASAAIGKKTQVTSGGEVLMAIGVCEKVLNISSRKHIIDPAYKNDTKTLAFLELLYRIQPSNDWVTFSLGTKYFLSNVSVFEDDSNISLSLGVGINFSAL